MKFKIIVAGVKSVGKSSLLDTHCERVFDPREKSIGAAFFKKEVSIDGKNADLQFWELSSEKKYQCLSLNYVMNTNIILFLFDLSEK